MVLVPVNYQKQNATIMFSEGVDPMGVLAERWSLVQEQVKGYILQYQLVNTEILFSEEVDLVRVLAECWSLVRELVEGYIWQ
jgi:hypothetical protein